MNDLDPDVASAIVAEVEPGSVVVEIADLTGGLSAFMTTIELERPDGTTHRLIVRRGRRPDSDRHTLPFRTEFELLQHVEARGIPVAKARAFDDSGRFLPQAYLVLDFVAGATRFATHDPLTTARRMAVTLAAIHDVDVTAPSFPALPNHVDRMEGWVISDLDRREADETLRESLVRRCLDRHWPPPDSEMCLLHADYFPGNIVWRDDCIAAVIDWESAALGDPMADVATSRLDLRWVYGAEAAEAFTAAYLAQTGRSPETLAVWELVVSLRPAGAVSLWAKGMAESGRPDVTPATMRADQHAFVDDALDRLGPE